MCISDVTGAYVTGIDYIPEAIRQAQERARRKLDRLAFQVGDIGQLDLARSSVDTLVSIDTLYFTDLDETIARMRGLLKPGGQMAIFYSHGANPEAPCEVFPRETLPWHKTPLAQALQKSGLRFYAWDFTAADYAHAQLKRRATEALKAEFEAEGNQFLYDSRHGEAEGVIQGIEAHAYARYPYHVLVDS